MNAMHLAETVLLAALAAGFWAFAGLYFFRARWERSSVGRGLLAFSVACGALLVVALAGGLLGGHALFAAARLVLYGVVLVVLSRMIWIFVRAQRSGRPTRGKGDPDGA